MIENPGIIAARLVIMTKPPNRVTHGNVMPSPYTVAVAGVVVFEGVCAPTAHNAMRMSKAAVAAAITSVGIAAQEANDHAAVDHHTRRLPGTGGNGDRRPAACQPTDL